MKCACNGRISERVFDLTIRPLELALEVQRQSIQHIQIDGGSWWQGLDGSGAYQLHLLLLILHRWPTQLLSTMICIMNRPF